MAKKKPGDKGYIPLRYRGEDTNPGTGEALAAAFSAGRKKKKPSTLGSTERKVMAEDKKTKRARAAMKDMGTVTKSESTEKRPFGRHRHTIGWMADQAQPSPRKYKDKAQGKYRMKTVPEPRKAVKGTGKMRVLDKVVGPSRYGESDWKYDLTRQIAGNIAKKDAKKAITEADGSKPGKIDMKKMKKPVEYVKAAQAARDEMAAAKRKLKAKKINRGQYDEVMRKYGYGPRSGHFSAQEDPMKTDFPERKGRYKFDRKESRKTQKEMMALEKKEKAAKAKRKAKRVLSEMHDERMKKQRGEKE